MGLTKDQIKWLNKCHGWAYLKAKWTFNEETGLVDVDGDFKTPNSHNSCSFSSCVVAPWGFRWLLILFFIWLHS